MEENARIRRVAGVLVAATAAVAAARYFLPECLNDAILERDLCQHVWWTQRFADPALFPGDPIAAFMSSPIFDPIGFQAIYALLVPRIGAEPTAHLLPFLLVGAAGALAWRAGRVASGGSLAGAVAGALLVLRPGSINLLEGGLPRNFALPLLLLGAVGLLERRGAWFGVSLLLGSVLYPPAVVNLLLLGALVYGVRLIRERRLPEGIPGLLAFGLPAGILLVRLYAQPAPEGIGPKVSYAEAREMPEFGPEGRSRFFSDDPEEFWFHGRRSGIGDSPGKLAVILALVLGAAALWRRAVPVPVYGIAISAVAAFLLAHATLFALHLPNRYAVAPLSAFQTLWGACVAPRLLSAVAAFRPLAPVSERLARGAIAVPLASALLAGYGIQTGLSVRRQALGKPTNPDFRAALSALAALPKDTLVAAHPLDADLVPLRAGRSVLANRETALPYYRGYYARVKERTEASFRACFATRIEDADALRALYGVDVFLVNGKNYDPGKPPSYSAPFGDLVRRLYDEGRAKGFALRDPPSDRVLFRSGSWTVVRLRPRG